MLGRLRSALKSSLSLLLGVTLLLLVMLELVEIVLRYFFLTTLPWSSDVAGLLLLILGWFGAAYLWLVQGHITVNLFFTRETRIKRLLTYLPDVLMILCAAWLLPAMLSTMEVYSSMIMPALNAPASLKFVPTVLAIPVIIVAALLNLAEQLNQSPDQRTGSPAI